VNAKSEYPTNATETLQLWSLLICLGAAWVLSVMIFMLLWPVALAMTLLMDASVSTSRARLLCCGFCKRLSAHSKSGSTKD
jgi:hypothetical protein